PPAPTRDASDSSPLWGAVSLLLGLLVALLGFFALMMWIDARDARNAANRAAARVTSASTAAMPGTAASLGDLTSYAGAAPANADELAMAHNPYPAAMPALQAGPVARFNLVLT